MAYRVFWRNLEVSHGIELSESSCAFGWAASDLYRWLFATKKGRIEWLGTTRYNTYPSKISYMLGLCLFLVIQRDWIKVNVDSSRPQPHFSQPHFSQPCAARSCMARTRLHPFRECFHTTTKSFNWVFKLMYRPKDTKSKSKKRGY